MEGISILGFISNSIDIALNAPSIKRIQTAKALSAELETQKKQISLKREELRLWNDGIEIIKKLNHLIEKDKQNPEARHVWLEIKNNVEKKIGLSQFSYNGAAKINYESKQFLDLHS